MTIPCWPPSTPCWIRSSKLAHKVYATGKIDDLFGGRGITKTHHSVFNMESIQAMVDFMDEDFTGMLFANLVEFDMTYGHRNDVKGYGA